MAASSSSWIVLREELPAILLDPDLTPESRERLLARGSLVEDVDGALDRAEAAGHEQIVVRVRGDAAQHLARVRCDALRGAMPRPD